MIVITIRKSHICVSILEGWPANNSFSRSWITLLSQIIRGTTHKKKSDQPIPAWLGPNQLLQFVFLTLHTSPLYSLIKLKMKHRYIKRIVLFQKIFYPVVKSTARLQQQQLYSKVQGSQIWHTHSYSHTVMFVPRWE